MRKTVTVGKFHLEIKDLGESLFVRVVEYPECTALFRKEEFPFIRDEMRGAILRHMIETGQTGLKKFDAKVRKRLREEETAAEKKKQQSK